MSSPGQQGKQARFLRSMKLLLPHMAIVAIPERTALRFSAAAANTTCLCFFPATATGRNTSVILHMLLISFIRPCFRKVWSSTIRFPDWKYFFRPDRKYNAVSSYLYLDHRSVIYRRLHIQAGRYRQSCRNLIVLVRQMDIYIDGKLSWSNQKKPVPTSYLWSELVFYFFYI